MLIKDKVLYLILGVFIGLVSMMSYLSFNQNESEAMLSKINYQSGCLLIATRINEKQPILTLNYWTFCHKESEKIYNTYLSLSDQMEKIMELK